MLSQEEIDQQVQLLETNRQTLAVYLRQEATIGKAFSPPALVTGIQEARRNIRRIKAELRANGVSVHEDPSDEELAPTVVLKVPEQPRARLPILALVLGMVLLIAGVAVGVLISRAGANGSAAAGAPAEPTESAATPPEPTADAAPAALPEPSATAAPEASDTGSSYDYTFDDGTVDGWSGDQASWSVIKDGDSWIYQGTAPDNQDTSTTPPIGDLSDWTDYSVEMRVRIVKPGRPDDDLYDMWVTARYNQNTSGCAAYDFYLDAHQGEYLLAPSGDSSCQWEELRRVSSELRPNQWYTIRVEVLGSQLRLLRDDQDIFETSDDRFKQGDVILGLGSGTVAQFDEIQIKKLTT